MPTYDDDHRPLTLTTPLAQGDFLPVGFQGHEGISQLFEFELELIALNERPIRFERLLGQKVTLHLLQFNNQKRHFSGICRSVSEGLRDPYYTSYGMTIVPEFWLLGQRTQSRIFQQKSVPDILRDVLQGLDVVFQLRGSYYPRDYCVQYRESDRRFASRLMEEEGIYYFFEHSESGHTMVVADDPLNHPVLPQNAIVFYAASQAGLHDEQCITRWEKTQDLRAGKVTLRDYCFELPDKHLEAEQLITESVAVGGVRHALKVAQNDRLELYDYPGGYAQRFDGVNPSGGDRREDLERIFEDHKRTALIRMEQEAVSSLLIQGASKCPNFIPGYTFALQNHFNADDAFLLTSVRHQASHGQSYRSGDIEFTYENTFECIPVGLPYRPQRVTRKPTVRGTQTAVVVGPSGEEIFTDRYGRVKVQFHWDRQGENNSNSSCWIRVGTPWAGKNWGMIHIPRIGQEVIVDFEEGDPDMPLIIGSVYNADMMPPYTLPQNKTQSGVKSRSTLNGTPANYNEIRFEDLKGSELVTIHAERNQSIEVENDETHWVGHDRTKTVDHDETTTVKHDRTESVGNNETIDIKGNRTEHVAKDETVKIDGQKILKVGKNLLIDVGTEIVIKTGSSSIVMKADGTITIKGINIKLDAGQSQMTLDPTGVTIKGMMVQAQGQVSAQVKAAMTQVNGDAMLQLQGGITMIG